MTNPQGYRAPPPLPSLDECIQFIAKFGGTLEFTRTKSSGYACQMTVGEYYVTYEADDPKIICDYFLRPAVQAAMEATKV